MSLFAKLEQKRDEKTKQAKEAETAGKKQTVEQIAAQITAAEEKKQRIVQLVTNLQTGYDKTGDRLEAFKGEKEKLEKAYEDNKDILEEEGIPDFDAMLKANAEEPEVRQLRRSGGRGPAREDGTPGETGQLYQGVKSLSEIKAALQAEMPELKLNFTGGKKADEEISDREFALAQIENRLKDLDQEIISLQTEKAKAYLETPEGKREAILKVKRPEYILSNARLDNVEDFYFSEDLLKLGEKLGPEAIKEVYTEELSKKLEEQAWRRKGPSNGSSVEKSEEQKAIEAYPALDKIQKANYNRGDLDKFQVLHQEALNHLAKIFQNEKARDAISQYGISGGPGREDKYRSWNNDERIRADRYLRHVAQMSNIVPQIVSSLEDYDTLIEQFQISISNLENGNFNRGANCSPEFFHACFENYSKFLEYIKTQTNEDTKFVGDPFRDKDSLAAKFKDADFRKEVGIEVFKGESRLNIPREFIEKNGGFRNAFDKASKAGESWENEKKGIAELSKAAVDHRWAQSWSGHYNQENRAVIEKLDYDKNLAAAIRANLDKSSLLNNPEFADRKVKLESGGYSPDRVLKDLTSEETYRGINERRQALNQEIANYKKQAQEAIGKEIGELKRKLIVIGREEKMSPLSKRWDFMGGYEAGRNFSWEVVEKFLTPDELTKIRSFEERNKTLSNEYSQHDKKRLEFLEASKIRNFYLNLKNDDPLNGLESILKDLPARLKERAAELEAQLNNLPHHEAAISAERDRSLQELEATQKAFQEAAVKNAALTRKK